MNSSAPCNFNVVYLGTVELYSLRLCVACLGVSDLQISYDILKLYTSVLAKYQLPLPYED